MLKATAIVLLLFTVVLSSTAQSDFDLTQRWFNESLYNPAATGNSFTTSIFLHGRKQWATLDGAPSTQAISVDTYIEQINSAFGLAVIGDQIGYINTINGKISYAYYISTGKKSALSLGLSMGILSRNKSPLGVDVDQLGDPLLFNISEASPDFDFGAEFKGPLKIGAAVRHIGLTSSSNNLPNPTLNIWTYASSRFNINNKLSIEPVVSYMFRDKVSRYEIGTILYTMKMQDRTKYNDRFWVGAMYRLHGQLAVLAGLNITKQLRFGYSFDYGVGDLQTISKFGTHEILIAWQLGRIFYKEPECPAYKINKQVKNKYKR